MTGAEILHTSVEGIEGIWPDPPDEWSYSSLLEATTCPRRWGLTRAQYPGVWSGSGYPPRPTLASLLGQVTHRCLEWVLHAFEAAGCCGPHDPEAVTVLRQLGGYSDLLERAIDEIIGSLENNPRLEDRLPHLRRSMRRYLPELRFRVQSLASRVQMAPREGGSGRLRGEVDTLRAQIGELKEGSYAEVQLSAEPVGMRGVVDLLTVYEDYCHIVEYKSGREQDYHQHQLHTYQVLWAFDRGRNPRGLPVEGLDIVYPTTERRIDPLTTAELNQFANRLQEDIAASHGAVASRPPPAVPTTENCNQCPVRHICEVYWETSLPAGQGVGDGFGDAALLVLSQEGRRTWRVRDEHEGIETLLHAPNGDSQIASGEKLRLLNVAWGASEGDAPPVLTLTATSECYVVN